jgi:hypothetical protein
LTHPELGEHFKDLCSVVLFASDGGVEKIKLIKLVEALKRLKVIKVCELVAAKRKRLELAEFAEGLERVSSELVIHKLEL